MAPFEYSTFVSMITKYLKKILIIEFLKEHTDNGTH